MLIEARESAIAPFPHFRMAVYLLLSIHRTPSVLLVRTNAIQTTSRVVS